MDISDASRTMRPDLLRDGQARRTLARAITDAVRHPMLVLDTDLAVVAANRAFCDAFAVTPGEAEGRRIYELGDGRWNVPALHRLLGEILPRDGAVEGFEITQGFGAGGQRTLLLNARRLDGDAHLILLGVEDVTRRRRAEEVGAEWRRRYAAAVRAGGLVLYDSDKRTGATAWSGETERVLGYPRAEMGGYAWWIERVHPDDRERVNDGVRLALARRQAVDLEYRLRHRDGSHIVVADQGELHCDEAGEVVRVVGFVRDITERKLAEQALRRERELLQRIMDTIPVMIALYEPDTKVLRLNREFERVTGWSTEEARQVDLMAKCYPDPEYRETIRAYMASLQEGWRDIEMTTKDGRILQTSWANIRLSDDTHIGIGIDITERKRGEEALRRSEERFRTLLENLPQRVWLATADGAVHYVNRSWLEYTGFAAEDAARWSELVYLEDRERHVRERAEATRADRPFETQSRIRRSDGAYRWQLTRMVPLRAEGGTFAWLGSWTDIDDIRRAEAALKESETRFRTLADSAPVLIWMSGLDKGGVYFNKPWLDFTGRAIEQELGAGWMDAVHPEDRPALEACAEAFALLQSFRTEFRLRRRDGAWRWMLDTGVPRFAPDGTFAGYIGSCIDITERKQAEEQRELLLAELSHRVKNTLATVQSIASQTLADGVDPNVARCALGGRLRALAQTHTLLAEGDWRGVGLRAVMRAELAPYGDHADIAGEDLALRPRAALTLGMAVHELATNAAKYGALSGPGGRIEVAWSIVADKGEEEGEAVLCLTWREKGGPPVRPPERRGFGRALIERGIAHDLAGAARLEFRPEGLYCELEVPLEEAVAA